MRCCKAGAIAQPDRLTPGVVRGALADVLADPAYARSALAQQVAIAALPDAAEVMAGLTARIAA